MLNFDMALRNLMLLPTFVGIFQEKICSHVSFTKILANYISEKSFISAVSDKNML